MADSSSQQPSLTVLGGPMAGQRLALDESVANLLIGSDPSCDFYLPHDSVSPIHARLWLDLDGAVLHETSTSTTTGWRASVPCATATSSGWALPAPPTW